MKMKLISVECGLSAAGFRRVAAIAKSSSHDVEICFVATDNRFSTFAYMFPYRNDVLDQGDIEPIARYLADAEVAAFSSMSIAKDYVEPIMRSIRKLNPNCKIIWGGAHPTLHPEEALQHADLICQGFGEQWMADYLGIENVLLHPYQGYECMMYDSRIRKFQPLTPELYAIFTGTFYRTMFTTGCPYSCIYCANDALAKIDEDYRKIKHPPIPFIIEEIAIAKKIYPFTSVVGFDDDNFIALSLPLIREFCDRWKQEIKLPFVVYGMHPNLVREDKVELLGEAGMNRVRMGIQSGSQKSLNFYHRNTPVSKVISSATTLIRAGKRYGMVPPSFDIISDNPIEAPEEVSKTLRMLHRLERPFTLNVFSLRCYPKTQLAELLHDFASSSYLFTRQTMNNILFYLIATVRLPGWLFEWLLKRYDRNPEKPYPIWFNLIKTVYAINRGIGHLIRCDFSRLGGKWGYYIWQFRNR